MLPFRWGLLCVVALLIGLTHGASINSEVNDGNNEYIDEVRRSKRTYKHGQTQSQYLNFGQPELDGKADAEATESGSRSTVSGTHGMGQAQSQFSGGDCSGCGVASPTYEYSTGSPDPLRLSGNIINYSDGKPPSIIGLPGTIPGGALGPPVAGGHVGRPGAGSTYGPGSGDVGQIGTGGAYAPGTGTSSTGQVGRPGTGSGYAPGVSGTGQVGRPTTGGAYDPGSAGTGQIGGPGSGNAYAPSGGLGPGTGGTGQSGTGGGFAPGSAYAPGTSAGYAPGGVYAPGTGGGYAPGSGYVPGTSGGYAPGGVYAPGTGGGYAPGGVYAPGTGGGYAPGGMYAPGIGDTGRPGGVYAPGTTGAGEIGRPGSGGVYAPGTAGARQIGRPGSGDAYSPTGEYAPGTSSVGQTGTATYPSGIDTAGQVRRPGDGVYSPVSGGSGQIGRPGTGGAYGPSDGFAPGTGNGKQMGGPGGGGTYAAGVGYGPSTGGGGQTGRPGTGVAYTPGGTYIPGTGVAGQVGRPGTGGAYAPGNAGTGQIRGPGNGNAYAPGVGYSPSTGAVGQEGRPGTGGTFAPGASGTGQVGRPGTGDAYAPGTGGTGQIGASGAGKSVIGGVGQPGQGRPQLIAPPAGPPGQVQGTPLPLVLEHCTDKLTGQQPGSVYGPQVPAYGPAPGQQYTPGYAQPGGQQIPTHRQEGQPQIPGTRPSTGYAPGQQQFPQYGTDQQVYGYPRQPGYAPGYIAPTAAEGGRHPDTVIQPGPQQPSRGSQQILQQPGLQPGPGTAPQAGYGTHPSAGYGQQGIGIQSGAEGQRGAWFPQGGALQPGFNQQPIGGYSQPGGAQPGVYAPPGSGIQPSTGTQPGAGIQPGTAFGQPGPGATFDQRGVGYQPGSQPVVSQGQPGFSTGGGHLPGIQYGHASQPGTGTPGGRPGAGHQLATLPGGGFGQYPPSGIGFDQQATGGIQQGGGVQGTGYDATYSQKPSIYGQPISPYGQPAYGTQDSGLSPRQPTSSGTQFPGTRIQSAPGGIQYGQAPQQIVQPGATYIPGGLQTTGDPTGAGVGAAEDAFSQAESSIGNGQASASAQGKKNGGTAKTQVQGTYSSSGSFSASAMTSDNDRSASSQVTGGVEGAMSQSQGQGGAAQSQAQVQVNEKTGGTKASSQSGGIIQQSQSEVQANDKGGLADAQSSGPGQTSSQAQIGFRPGQDGEILRSVGGGQAAAQSGAHYGNSQSQIQGTSKYGVSYHGAAQSASGTKEQVATYREQNRVLFNTISQFGSTDAITDRVDTVYNPSLTSESDIPDLQLKNSRTNKEVTNSNKLDDDSAVPDEDEEEEPYDEYEDEEDYYNENPIKMETKSDGAKKVDSSTLYRTHTQTSPTQTQQVAVGDPTKKYSVVQNQNGRVQTYSSRTTTETVPNGFRGTVNVEKKFHTKSLEPHKTENKLNITANEKSPHKPRTPDSYVTVTKSITGSMDNSKNPPQDNKNFQSTYYTKSSTCGYFTFSCNIVYGANGRSKICRPKAPTNGKC